MAGINPQSFVKISFTFFFILSAFVVCIHRSTVSQNQRADGQAATPPSAGLNTAPAKGNKVDQKMQASVETSYLKLPLSFEEHKGQAEDGSEFLSRGDGYTLRLSQKGATISLRRPDGQESKEADDSIKTLVSESATYDHELIDIKPVGANSSPVMRGEDKLRGKSNYFRGKSSGWQTNISTFAKVRYQDIYPGIDLVYYGNQQQLEYDFVVAPGANPQLIKLQITGAQKIEVDEQGDLLLNTKNGVVRQHRPIIYQESEGDKHEIPGRYQIESQSMVTFVVGDYDKQKPLVIDPILVYSTYFGGSSNRDVSTTIELDASGNVYVAGYTASTDFPLTSPTQSTYKGSDDIFVLKLNPSGTEVLYSTYIGGVGIDRCFDMAVDSAGQAHLTGLTSSADFPVANSLQPNLASSGGSAFITKLAMDGSSLLYSTYLGGSVGDVSHSIALDAQGNAYVLGETYSRDFPLANAYQSSRTDNHMLRSMTGGGNWIFSNISDSVRFINTFAFDPTAPLTVYAGTELGIFKSLDGGTSWTRVGASQVTSRVNKLVVDTTNASTIYSATSTGIYKSTDAGASWTAINQGLTSTSVYDLVIDPSSPATLYAATGAPYGGLFKSSNGGATWTPLTTGFGIYNTLSGTIVIDPTNPLKIYAATPDGVFRTTNGGSSWSVSLTNDWITSLVINPSSPTTLYASGSGGIYKSTDGGVNWSQNSSIAYIGSLVIDPTNPSILYASNDRGEIYKSTDAGANWLPTNTGLRGTSVSELALNPSDPSRLFAGVGAGTDLFVSKLNSSGSALIYSTYIGGRESETGSAIAVDSAGNAYITGITSSGDFPLASAIQQSINGSQDLFVTKLSPAGSALIYSTFLGGRSDEYPQAIAVDAQGNAILTGTTYSWDYPTANALKSECLSCHVFLSDAFVTKLNATGSALSFSTFLGGADNDYGYDLTLDEAANVYVAGGTSSRDFPTQGATQSIFGGALTDGFLAKLNPSGSGLIYSTFLGGAGIDNIYSLTVDSSGNAYVTGPTSSSDFPLAAPLRASRNGTTDIFIAKLAASAELAVTMTDSPDPLDLGSNLTYTINVKNSGELIAGAVTLQDTLPVGATFVSVSTSRGSCSGTGPVICSLGDMGKDETAIITLVVTPTAGSSITNTASVTASTPDGNQSNNTAVQTTQVRFADLSVKNTASLKIVPAGSKLTYIVTVSNVGNSAANNVTVTDTIPDQASFVECQAVGGQCQNSGGSMTATFASILPGKTATATFTVLVSNTAPPGTSIASTATAAASNPDPNQSSNSATVVSQVASPIAQKSNGRILFASTRDESNNTELYVMDADGSNVVRLTNSPNTDYQGVWSPDGSKIAFISFRSGGNLFIMNADGTGVTKLTSAGAEYPSWSPDGTRLAFIRGSSIYVINGDGTGEAKLASNGKIMWDSEWSPDGSKLVYMSSGTSTSNDVFVVYADGSVETNLTNDGNSDLHPSWSPDGSKIVFSKDVNNQRGIYVMNSDGTNTTKLATCPYTCTNPNWSPDGKMIIYSSQTATGYSEIYSMNADGSNQVNLTKSNKYNDFASWQPLVSSVTSSAIQFGQSSYSFNETTVNTPQGFGALNVTVTRTDASAAATVQYFTSDLSGGNECNQVTGQASQRCDYATAAGTLRFVPGEANKTIQIPIVLDGYVEGNESFIIRLQNPVGGTLGTNSQATLIIQDSGMATTAAQNPYLNNQFFVRQLYLDILGREPDAEGFATWTGVLNNCGPEKGFLGAPRTCDRAFVSHGFVASPEFTDRGYRIHRMYEVGLKRLPTYAEFVPDAAATSGAAGSIELEQNIVQYADTFVTKPEFLAFYGGVSGQQQAEQYIALLEQNAGVTLPATTTTLPGQPPQYGRQQLIDLRAAGTFSVGQTLRAFVEQKVVYDKYFERGFVTIQYFGFLRRDPALGDPTLSGWTEWVYVFTNGGATRGRPDIGQRDIQHLIFGFIYSDEYRKRFGQP